MLKAILLIVPVLLSACSSSPPSNIDDSCEIFREKDDWYDDAKDSFERWGVPIHVQLAFIITGAMNLVAAVIISTAKIPSKLQDEDSVAEEPGVTAIADLSEAN